jgi:transposase
LNPTESQHGAIGRGLSRFGTLNLTSIKISGYCWSKTELDGIPVRSWCVAVGIDLFFLPSHSPELPPAERLWPLTNEA